MVRRKYLAFDIETTKIPPAGEDWRSLRPLGISCAATWAVDSNQPLIWHGKRTGGGIADQLSLRDGSNLVDFLSEQVRRGYTIVTWNGVGFDFDVLAEESGKLNECRRLALNHVDMMFHVLCQIGHGIGLGGHEGTVHLTRGNKRPLEVGMCFSNEPGIYIHGEFGVRIEDCIHITEDGARFFSEPQLSYDQV